MIIVEASKNKAWCPERELLTAGSVGVTVDLRFSADWDDLQVFGIFRAYNVSAAVAVTGDSVEIPASVLANPNVHLLLGLYGVAEDGTVVIPTLYADLGVVREAANLTGADNYVPPDASLYAQVLKLAGDAQAAANEATSGEYAGTATFTINSAGKLVMSVTRDGSTSTSVIGDVSAYAAALAAGYTGTYEEFCDMLIANSQVSDKQDQHQTEQVTLEAEGTMWTVSSNHATASNTVLWGPAPGYLADASEAVIELVSQGNGTLSFVAAQETTRDIKINLVFLD